MNYVINFYQSVLAMLNVDYIFGHHSRNPHYMSDETIDRLTNKTKPVPPQDPDFDLMLSDVFNIISAQNNEETKPDKELHPLT